MNLRKIALALTLAITVTSFSFANASTVKSSPKAQEVVKDIVTIMKDLKYDFQAFKDETVKVRFMINADNEIIVLGTDNPELDETMKALLNYKKVGADSAEKFHVYVVPVSFRA